MTKKLVQISDELYRKAKAITAAREWSQAERMRRGLEYMAQTDPLDAATDEWESPIIRGGEPLRVPLVVSDWKKLRSRGIGILPM